MKKRINRFFGYSAIGVTTFLIDLSILWILTDVFGLYYLVATLSAFLVAVSVNYFVGRKLVFNKTKRALGEGYLYFLSIVTLGAILTLCIMYVLINYTQLSVIIARIITAGFIGIFNFLMNDVFNFKIK